MVRVDTCELASSTHSLIECVINSLWPTFLAWVILGVAKYTIRVIPSLAISYYFLLCMIQDLQMW